MGLVSHLYSNFSLALLNGNKNWLQPVPITIPTPTNLRSAIIWGTISLLSSLSANDLTARIKCTPCLATTPHPSAVASKRYINDSHTPRTLVKWWSKPLLPLITIIVVGIINETCDVKVIFNCCCHECHTRENSIQHPKQMSLWCDKTISKTPSYVIMRYDYWKTWKSTADQNTLFLNVPHWITTEGQVWLSLQLQIKPSLRLQTWETEGTQKLQTTISFSLDQQCGFSDYPLP